MKRGISLIAILMFMLASTTASIVLFNWLSSEDAASGSRLKRSEAYQASESGLDAVRAWLSFKAADVGYVLKDHFDNDNAAFFLNSVLGEWGSGKQDFRVYLVGADTVSKPYKLKFMSVGLGRDSSRVSQTAIFNVDGLYSVMIPVSMVEEERVINPTDFNEDFWGNMGTVNEIESMRMVMTQTADRRNAGGEGLNSITIGTNVESGYLVLDGDFWVMQHMTVYGDIYATGNLETCNSGDVSGNLYVEGVFSPRAPWNIGYDAFFKGGVNPNSKVSTGSCDGGQGTLIGNVNIGRNSTLQGDFAYLNSASTGIGFVVANNLVMEAGEIILTRPANQSTGSSLIANGNVYIARRLTGTIPSDVYPNTIPFFGNAAANTVCVPNVTFESTGIYSDNTNNSIKMSTNANPGNVFTNLALCPNHATWGADPMDGSVSDKDLKAKLEQGTSTNSCENPPIQFDMSIYEEVKKTSPANWVHSKDSPSSCQERFDEMVPSWHPDFFGSIQGCYDEAQTNGDLYKEEWLVVYINDLTNTRNPASVLTSGKYIIIWDIDPSITIRDNIKLYLPPTDDNVEVMLFFPNGYPGKIELNGTQRSTGYKYFIFSDGDIGEFETTKDRKLHGNIFMNRCKVMNLPNFAENPYFRSQSNTEFIEELMAVGILQKYDGSGAGGSSSSSSQTTAQVISGPDDYIIPLSPRLKVALESKYISKEPEPTAPKDVEDHVLVMPRVLRLSPTAFPTGTDTDLSDYYNLLYLNGHEPLSSSTPTCTNPDDAARIIPAEGVYVCTFNNAKVSDFYVKIQATDNTGDGSGGEEIEIEISSSSYLGSSSSSSSLPSSSSVLSSSSGGGGTYCAYQPGWCDGQQASAVLNQAPDRGNSCFFVTEITKFCSNNGNSYINGTNVGQGNFGCWSGNGILPAKQDGGYYIWVDGGIESSNWDGTAGETPNCAWDGSVSSSSSAPSSSSAVTLTCVLPSPLIAGAIVDSDTQRSYLTCSNTGVAPSNNPSFLPLIIFSGIVAEAGSYPNIKATVNCGTEVGAITGDCNPITINPATVTCNLPELVAGTTYRNSELRGFLICSNNNPPSGAPSFSGNPAAPISSRTVATAGSYTNVQVTVNCGTNAANATGSCGTSGNLTITAALPSSSSAAPSSSSSDGGDDGGGTTIEIKQNVILNKGGTYTISNTITCQGACTNGPCQTTGIGGSCAANPGTHCGDLQFTKESTVTISGGDLRLDYCW